MFEPFIEDDASFEEYCKSMKEDGTWAGNMELQAASLVTRSNICIHRVRFVSLHFMSIVHLFYCIHEVEIACSSSFILGYQSYNVKLPSG